MKRALLIVAAVGAFVPSLALASTTQYGYITNITPSATGAVNFYFDGTRTTPPGCSTTPSVYWGFDASNTGGQNILSALLTAYSLHKRIQITGSGSCPAVLGPVEGIAYFTIEN